MAEPKSRARLKGQSTKGRRQRAKSKGQVSNDRRKRAEGKGRKTKGTVNWPMQRANSQMWRLETTCASKRGCLMTHFWLHAPHYDLLMNLLMNLLTNL